MIYLWTEFLWTDKQTGFPNWTGRVSIGSLNADRVPYPISTDNNVPRKTNSNDSVPEIRTTNNNMLPETITGVSKLEQHISKCLPKRRQGSLNYNTDINMFLDTKTGFSKLEHSISICFSNRFVNSTVSIEKKVFISNNKCNYWMTDNSLVGKPRQKIVSKRLGKSSLWFQGKDQRFLVINRQCSRTNKQRFFIHFFIEQVNCTVLECHMILKRSVIPEIFWFVLNKDRVPLNGLWAPGVPVYRVVFVLP